jgi:hypothetical protein
MLRRVIRASLLTACLTWLGVSTAFAQSANIGGVVTDSNGRRAAWRDHYDH